MLVYLDNTLSTSPASPRGRNSKAGLNENFAREVMELHTLGVDGGYTEEDVVTLARVLTGWRVNRPDSREFPEYAAVFEGARHDFSPKVFLGQQLRSSGKAEGEEALDILAKSPATARHISFKLAQYFVADLANVREFELAKWQRVFQLTKQQFDFARLGNTLTFHCGTDLLSNVRIAVLKHFGRKIVIVIEPID